MGVNGVTFEKTGPLYVEKTCPTEMLPCMSQLSYIYLQYMANCSVEKRKNSASRVTLLAWPTLHPYKHFVAGSTLSGQDNQSIHKHCWLRQAGHLFPI